MVLCGVFLPTPVTGFRAAKAGLLASTYIQAQQVTLVKASYASHVLDEVGLEIATLSLYPSLSSHHFVLFPQ